MDLTAAYEESSHLQDSQSNSMFENSKFLSDLSYVFWTAEDEKNIVIFSENHPPER